MSIDLNYDYLDRVRRIAALYTKRKTSDLLDGDFSSMQHGRSLDFDDLREYRYGDDINYIDWKSSSRVGKPLVRRYFADRKHDVLFIGDTAGRRIQGAHRPQDARRGRLHSRQAGGELRPLVLHG